VAAAATTATGERPPPGGTPPPLLLVPGGFEDRGEMDGGTAALRKGTGSGRAFGFPRAFDGETGEPFWSVLELFL
jgi:hypothetical protein